MLCLCVGSAKARRRAATARPALGALADASRSRSSAPPRRQARAACVVVCSATRLSAGDGRSGLGARAQALDRRGQRVGHRPRPRGSGAAGGCRRGRRCALRLRRDSAARDPRDDAASARRAATSIRRWPSRMLCELPLGALARGALGVAARAGSPRARCSRSRQSRLQVLLGHRPQVRAWPRARRPPSARPRRAGAERHPGAGPARARRARWRPAGRSGARSPRGCSRSTSSSRSSASTRSCCSAYSRCLTRRSSCSRSIASALLGLDAARRSAGAPPRPRAGAAAGWRRGVRASARSPRRPRRGGSTPPPALRGPARAAFGEQVALAAPRTTLGPDALLAVGRLASLGHHVGRKLQRRAGRLTASAAGAATAGRRPSGRGCRGQRDSAGGAAACRATPAPPTASLRCGRSALAQVPLAAVPHDEADDRVAVAAHTASCYPQSLLGYAAARPSATAATTAR